MKKNLINISIAIVALFAIGIACSGGSKTSESETQAGPEYVGVWTAADGSMITVRSNGAGEYKIGGTSVNGGSAMVDDKAKTLRITLLGMGSPMKIDKAPANGEMTIDGLVYKRAGGSATTAGDVKPEVPSKEKLQTLVKTSFLEFGDAIKGEDFSDFHKKTAKVWRDSSTPEKLDEAFKVFTDKKEIYDFNKAVGPLDAEFSPEPKIETVQGMDALVVKGSYPTKPQKANFEFKYTMDDGSWKLIGIDVHVGNK